LPIGSSLPRELVDHRGTPERMPLPGAPTAKASFRFDCCKTFVCKQLRRKNRAAGRLVF
jgi:hypothetical protein